MMKVVVDDKRAQADPVGHTGNGHQRNERRPQVSDVIESMKHVEPRSLRSDGLGEQLVSTAGSELVTEPECLAAHALRLPGSARL